MSRSPRARCPRTHIHSLWATPRPQPRALRLWHRLNYIPERPHRLCPWNCRGWNGSQTRAHSLWLWSRNCSAEPCLRAYGSLSCRVTPHPRDSREKPESWRGRAWRSGWNSTHKHRYSSPKGSRARHRRLYRPSRTWQDRPRQYIEGKRHWRLSMPSTPRGVPGERQSDAGRPRTMSPGVLRPGPAG